MHSRTLQCMPIRHRDSLIGIFFLAGQPLVLTATEFDLLRALSVNAGRVTTYEKLLRQGWAGREHANEQLVRTSIKKLRRKLGDPADKPAYIVNERGVGYRMPHPVEP